MGEWIGRSVPRREDVELLQGHRRYVADLHLPASEWGSMAYVHVVGSHVAHGRIESIDTTEAARHRGVIAVITADDHDIVPRGSVQPEFYPPRYAMPLLAERVVRYVGEPVAVVVAESPQIATDAAELVIVDLEPLAAVIDVADSAADATILFADDTRARARDETTDAGPATNAVLTHTCRHEPSRFEADVVLQRSFWNPRQVPAPIETLGQVTAWSADGDLHIWASTQRPHGYRDQLADIYQLDAATIHVHAPEVGGGFGGKVSRTQIEQALPMIARRVGRPVRWVQSRSEYFTSATHGRGERIDFVLAGSRNGRISALRGDVLKDAGAYPGIGGNLPSRFNSLDPAGPYDIDHVEFGSVSVVTNAPQVSAFRGAGRAPYHAALERLIDLYAHEVGLDPVAVRRQNLIRLEQMPFLAPAGVSVDESDHLADLDRVLAMAGYDDLRAEQARRRDSGERHQLGIGIATFHLMTVGAGGEEAVVRLELDGSATVLTGTSDQGHGHSSTWAQLAAEQLGIDVERIAVLEGSTDHTPTGVGAVGSRSLQTAGIAIVEASRQLIERAKAIGARVFEADPADMVFAPDMPHGARFHVAGVPGQSVGWDAIARAATGAERDAESDRLQCGDFHDIGDSSTFPAGAYVAVVDVDTETGGVDVRSFHGVDDVGVRINPMIVEGQLHGGIAAGLSQVLGEVMHYDADGTPLSTSFIDYTLASTDQLPSFDLEPSETRSSHNELGAKGVGESGIVGSVPALHNAIVDAVRHLGVDHIELPCTPRRVWAAIRDADGAPA